MRKVQICLFIGWCLIWLGCESEQDKISANDLKELVETIGKSEVKDGRNEIYQIEVISSGPINQIVGKVSSNQVYDILKTNLKPFGNIQNHVRVVPDSVVGDLKYGLCTVSVGNIRSEPKHSAELSSQLLLGHPVRILDIQESWLQVQTVDKYIGWIDKGAIVRMDLEDFLEWEDSSKVILTKPYITSFNRFGQKAVVSDLTQGNILINLGRFGPDSLLLEYPDLRTGIVGINDVVDLEEWATGIITDTSNLGKIAKEYLGIPYLWGGTSIKGLDCSGFTKTVFFRNGILLQRDASQQATEGILIDSTGNLHYLNKGDLVFFGNKKKGETKVLHVGIVLEDLKFIHASGEGYVKINSLDSTSNLYASMEHKRYLFSRRYITRDSILNRFDIRGMYSNVLE